MLRIGVLGAGHLGKFHLQQIKEISGFELVGFYDPDPQRVREAEEKFGLKSFSDPDELIDQVQVVDIVTPTISHFDCAVKALKKQKHVFIEKPLANSVEEGLRLVELSKEANVKVQVGHVERFNPAFKAALPLMDNPLFIEGHRIAQFNPRGTDVSVVLDLMIHDLDLVLSVVKSNVRKISASGVAVVSDSPDIANARIEFDNGCVANLTASRISLKNMRKMRLFQRDAYVTVDFMEKEVNMFSMKDVEGEVDPYAMVMDLGEKGKKEVIFDAPEIAETNAIREELKSFYNSIKNNLVPEVSINDGYLAMKVADEIMSKVRKTPGVV